MLPRPARGFFWSNYIQANEYSKRALNVIIKIVGAGCPACQQLEADVRGWLTQHNVEAQVERIDDLVEILNYRLLALPGLVIDERIVMMGYHHAQLDRVLCETGGGIT
jgi:hypothetical protein